MTMTTKPPHSSRVRRFAFCSTLPVLLPVLAFGFGVGVMLSRSQQHERSAAPVHSVQPVPQFDPALEEAGLRLQVRRPENIKLAEQHVGMGDTASPTALVQYEEINPPEGEPQPLVQAATAGLALPSPPVNEEISSIPHQGRKQIAIVIDDVGPDRRGSRQAIALPSGVTLAFLPYAENLSEQVAAAHAARHQVIIHMPMEPENLAGNNPGPLPLLVSLGADEIRQRLRAAFDAVEGEVGLNNHMGSRYTTSLAAMQPVMGELAARNLFFLDSRTTADSVGETLARRYGVRYVARDVFLDNDLNPAAIEHQLAEVARRADRKGVAVAIGHPHAETMAALRQWIPLMQQRGYQFVAVGELARRLPASEIEAVADRR